MTQFLIVTADDLGYSEVRDDGIVECFQAGAISQTSLLVNGTSAESAVKKSFKAGLPIGLHLNLTEGLPVGDMKYTTLVGEDGMFLGKMGLREAVRRGNIDLYEVKQEIISQVEKFEELTRDKPFSVDGHQHIHVVPGICEAFAEVLQERCIHSTRLPLEHGIESYAATAANRSFLQELLTHATQAAKVFTKHGLWFPGFTGLKTMGCNMSVQRLQTSIKEALNFREEQKQCSRPSSTSCEQEDCSSGGTTPVCLNNGEITVCEVMTHPGYVTKDTGGCGAGPDKFSMSCDREQEMKTLMDQEMKAFYTRKNITMITFKDNARWFNK